MNEILMLRRKVERCREAYEDWLAELLPNSPDRNEALTAYDAAQVALGKEWRAVEAVIERAEVAG